MDLNSVTLTGVLERDPVTRYAVETSSQQVGFTVRVEEVAMSGQLFKLFVPIECFGQAAQIAGDLNAGDSVLLSGKLKWTSYTAKDGTKKNSLCVLARLVKRLAPTAVPVAG